MQTSDASKKRDFCFECDCALIGPLCPKCNPLAHRPVLVDLKLIAVGVGIGALLCSVVVGLPGSTDCGKLAVTAVGAAVALRFMSKR